MTIEERTALTLHEDRILAIEGLETRFAMAVRQRELLEDYIGHRLKPDKHFYTVGDDPGRKPSLTKEGAELICLPHGLKSRYSILSGPDKPPADNSPYQITVNCSLWRGESFEGEGIGSASSYITKKDGTYQSRQKDPGLCYNATVKMASKSAYIAATLNSTAASEFFTQDLEDEQTSENSTTKEHWCSEHNVAFFLRGKMKSYAHPIGDTGEWCHEHKQKAVAKAKGTTQEEMQTSESTEQTREPSARDLVFAKIMERMEFTTIKTVRSWLINVCKIAVEKLDSDDLSWYEDVKQLQHWTD